MLDAHQIAEILPHRPPLLLVHRVMELTEERVVAQYDVEASDPLLEGHFPGDPVFPGVLVVEALGQAGGILAHYGGFYDRQRQVLLLAKVDGLRLLRPIRPGEQLELEVRALRRGTRIWKLAGSACVQGVQVAEAILVAAITPREELA